MDFRTIKYSKINEMLHVYEHKSGLKAYVIPKKGYSKKYAAFATHYGSINNEFVIPGEKEALRVPDGIAHFLEHKLFEQKDGSVMEKFAALGSSPNAYTSFNQTVYLFSCTDRFNENLKLLVNFVQNPYITVESVEKEKGIIAQEIKMYEDDPGWRSFFNLLKAFYEVNPVRIDIAGTVESIGKIDRDILYKCYNTFYHPSNMVLLAVGDIEPGEVFDLVEENIGITESMPEIKRIFPVENAKVNSKYIDQQLSVSTPMFQMGFKDAAAATKGIPCMQREAAVKILLESIMGRSSELYNRLYNEGLINNSFDFDYTIEENYAFSMFGGESPDPEKVRDRISQEISRLKRDGLNKDTIERVKRAMKGRFLKQLNSVERTAHNFISVYFKDINIFDYPDVYDKITFGHVSDIFHEHFNEDNLTLSVVKPF